MMSTLKVKVFFFTILFSDYLCAQCKPSPIDPTVRIPQTQVYAGMPFTQGEKASYEVRYYGVLVGHGHLEVKPPVLFEDNWHRHFTARASTGDWYRALFVASDFAMAYSRPQDFAVRKFYIKQDEGQIFGSRLIQEKWLTFDHKNCQVAETIKKKGKELKKEAAELTAGATDSLGAAYQMRSLNYKLGKPEKFLVYSSKKNWWLEITPLSIEKITVPAGTFETVKLGLKTLIGKDFQQKGEVHAWIATHDSRRPIVKIQGEIKVGSVDMVLSSYSSPKNS